MRPFPTRSCCIAFFFAALVALTLAQPQAVFAESDQKRPLPQQVAKTPQATDQEQFVSYWTTEPGWSTELQLRNNLESRELTVIPAVRTAAGVETALPAVAIRPGDVVSLDLYKTLMTAAPQLAGSWGSLVLRYRTVAHRALYAAAMVRADGRPITFHLDATGRGSKYEAGSREGIWWQPWELVTGYLILTNSGDQVLQPTLTLYDSSGKAWQETLSLGARETQRLSIRSLLQQAGLNGSYGGVKIDMTKGARFLDSTHLLFEESGAFSAIMKMFKHDPSTTLSSRSFGGVKEWTTRAPMLALSNPDPALRLPAGTTLQPKVFIRNATGKTFAAHIRFDWRSETASGKSAPLDLTFKGNETHVVDVAALQAQKLLPADAHWAAVILSASVLPDELLAVAASYDQTGRYGTQTPFGDQLASHWEGGKWEVDGTHNSLVTIVNGSNKTAEAQLTILYNQGTGQYQLKQVLAPDEQMALDFGKLIHDQIPDMNGHTLPSGLTEGTYRLLDLTDNPVGSLYEGKEIVDKTYGHAAYTCMICCGPDSPWMEYDPLSVLINSFEDQGVQAVNSCSERLVDVTGDFPTWWTDNTSIATATGKQINGVAVGTTNHNAQSINMYWGPKEDAPSCDLSQEQPSSPTNVMPKILLGGSNGTDITATTQSVVVGQQIVLYGSYSLPSGITVTSQAWTVPGTTVGGFSTALTNGGSTATNFSQQSTTFYWVVPATSQQVTFTLNLSNNTSPKVTATFNISGPTLAGVTTQLGQVVITSEPALSLGNYPSIAGIQLTASATPPTGYSNSFEWVQIITNDTKMITLNDNTTTTCVPATTPAGGLPFLDNGYPYDTNNPTTDIPETVLDSTQFRELTRNFSATMYLLWKPGLQNSIFVPLGTVGWQWSGDAVYNAGNQTWTLNSSSKSANAFSASSTYPTWTRYSDYSSQSCH